MEYYSYIGTYLILFKGSENSSRMDKKRKFFYTAIPVCRMSS